MIRDKKIAKISVPAVRHLTSTSEGQLLRRRLMQNGRPEAVPFYPHEFIQRQSSFGLIDPSARIINELSITDLNPLERHRIREIIRKYGGNQALLSLQALLDRDHQLKQERESANQWRSIRGYPLYPEFVEEECCDYLMPMVLLSINTGLRQGELFNLKWSMVDLSEGSIIISGDITKNNNSRYIPLNDEAINIMKQLYKKSALKEGLVFPNKNNQPLLY